MGIDTRSSRVKVLCVAWTLSDRASDARSRTKARPSMEFTRLHVTFTAVRDRDQLELDTTVASSTTCSELLIRTLRFSIAGNLWAKSDKSEETSISSRDANESFRRELPEQTVSKVKSRRLVRIPTSKSSNALRPASPAFAARTAANWSAWDLQTFEVRKRVRRERYFKKIQKLRKW